MYIEDKDKKKFRYEEYVQYIQRLYNNGKLIMLEDFALLSKLGQRMDSLNKHAHYLKKQATIEHFLGNNIEDFIVLTNSYNKLLKVAIDTSDYLKKNLGRDVKDDDVIFETDEEAVEAIDKVFEDIEKIKSDNDEYLTKEFSNDN